MQKDMLGIIVVFSKIDFSYLVTFFSPFIGTFPPFTDMLPLNDYSLATNINYFRSLVI